MSEFIQIAESMNLKKIVTVIVTAIVLCFGLSLPCEASTTKATTSDEIVSDTQELTKKKTTKNKKKSYSQKDLRYMSTIIYCEARGESYAGQKAVGIVVMNRVRSKKFPNNIKKVIYQRGQFSPVRNGSLDRAYRVYDKQDDKNKFTGEMKSCRKAAIEVLEGSTTIKVNGKKKEMKKYLFFSQYVKGAKYQLGTHQFK